MRFVLDLVYEAREYRPNFAASRKNRRLVEKRKRKGLNDWQKDELKKFGAHGNKVLGSLDRLKTRREDIRFDIQRSDLASDGRAMRSWLKELLGRMRAGTFELFPEQPFKGTLRRHHVVQPTRPDVTLEETVPTRDRKAGDFTNYLHEAL